MQYRGEQPCFKLLKYLLWHIVGLPDSGRERMMGLWKVVIRVPVVSLQSPLACKKGVEILLL